MVDAMEYLQNMREQVIARLVARHGLDHENAAAAWEEYLLDLLVKCMCREVAGLHIENN
jgi:hypothetical protein